MVRSYKNGIFTYASKKEDMKEYKKDIDEYLVKIVVFANSEDRKFNIV